MARFLLLHSPLVGPRTLLPLAGALNRLGHSAGVPDLRTAISAGGLSPAILRSLSVQAISDMEQDAGLVVAAHSGASVHLPILAAALDPRGQVLIDAAVPPVAGTFTPSANLRAELDRLVEADQRLPPWPQWWGDNAMTHLVPDPELRSSISGECPRLPISFYDTAIDVPPDWDRPWAGYLRLSPVYESEARIAAQRGWPVRRRGGGHLDAATRPDEIALDLLDLVRPVLDAGE